MVDVDSVDRMVSGTIGAQAIPGLSGFFYVVTQLGNGAIWALAFALYLAMGKKKLIAAVFLLALLFSSVVNEDVKDILRRDRPHGADIDPLLITGMNYSFPSNHAQTALLLAMLFVAYLGLRYSPVIYSVAALVCISRIYLGLHYFSDVVAGGIIGIVIGELVILGMYMNGITIKAGLSRYIARQMGISPPEAPVTYRQLSAVLVFPFIGFCIAAAAMLIGQYYLSLLVVAFSYLSSIILPGRYDKGVRPLI